MTPTPGRIPRRAALRATCAALALALGVGAASPAQALDGAMDVAEASFDLLVLRPVNLAAVAAGVAFFALSAPLVAPFEGLGTSWEVFVYQPVEYTFLRPVGEI